MFMPQSDRDAPALLTVNAGSSSVKWALFQVAMPPIRTETGHIERIGLPDGIVTVTDPATGRHARRARFRSRRLAVYTSLVRCGPSRVPLSLPSGRDPTCALPCTCSIERR